MHGEIVRATSSLHHNDGLDVFRTIEKRTRLPQRPGFNCLWRAGKLIAEVPAIGNSIYETDYAIDVPLRNAGTLYYRLSQVDVDGTTKTLRTLSARTDCQSEIAVSIQGNQLAIEAESDVQRVDVFNPTGQTMLQWANNSNNNQVKLTLPSSLQNGHYLIRITTTNQSTTKSINIQ